MYTVTVYNENGSVYGQYVRDTEEEAYRTGYLAQECGYRVKVSQ